MKNKTIFKAVVILGGLLLQACNSEGNSKTTGTAGTNVGPRGPAGIQGIQGATGPMGNAGTNGADGAAGAPGAIQIIGPSQPISYQMDGTYLNGSTKNIFVSGSIQMDCAGFFSSANLWVKDSSTADWELEHHVFKDAAVSNIRYPLSFLLKPGASFKVNVASNNDNTHCASGLTHFPDVQEWKLRELN